MRNIVTIPKLKYGKMEEAPLLSGNIFPETFNIWLYSSTKTACNLLVCVLAVLYLHKQFWRYSQLRKLDSISSSKRIRASLIYEFKKSDVSKWRIHVLVASGKKPAGNV